MKPGIEEGRLEAGALGFRFLAAGPAGGPPALLLHGFPEGAESWLPQLEALGERGYRALAPDLRGYGGSDCPVGVEHYRLEHLVEDVAAMAQAMGPPVHLAGHDWGAAVGWAFACGQPDLVRSWAALSVPHLAALAQASREDEDQQQRSSYIQLFLQTGKAEEVLSAEGFARLRRMFSGGSDAVPKWVVDQYAESLSRPYRLTAGLNYYRANLSGQAWTGLGPSLEPARVPTMLIWGDQDPALGRRGVESTGQHVEAPYTLEILEGAGHWLQFERPDQVSALLMRHFDSQ
jgi:pimeloyl-ACP methyl ester carboxylesterase